MPNFLESAFLPDVAALDAQSEAIDTHLADLERLSGLRQEEFNQRAKQQRAELLNKFGDYGMPSTQAAAALGSIESTRLQNKLAASADLESQRAENLRLKKQLAIMRGVALPQDVWGAVKGIGGTAMQVAGIATGNPLVAAAGGALSGGGPQGAYNAMELAQGQQGVNKLRDARMAALNPTGVLNYEQQQPPRYSPDQLGWFQE